MSKPRPGVKKVERPSRRGRPRSLDARRSILHAARELLTEGGIAAVTIEAIATRSGISKPTIYRSWPNAHAVAMAALMENVDMSARVATVPAKRQHSGSICALRAQLHDVARVFSAPLGRNVAVMIAASERETELSKAFRDHFILARRTEGRSFVRQAIADGELRTDLDVEVTLDLIYAPIFYRLLMGHAPLDARFTDSVLTHVLRGLSTDPAGARA
jgi:AcrR family transcriptional regulator